MGEESEVVRTHGQEGLKGHVFVLEVLRGVLYPEAHVNRSKKKKKKKKKENGGSLIP
jgi:hypothetical protein